MFYDAFDKNLPTIEETECLLLDSNDLVKSNEDAQNNVDELGINEYGIYDVHAFQALAFYLSTVGFSPNDKQ